MGAVPKPPNIFGQVLGAILAAAAMGAIIFGIWLLHSQSAATDKAFTDLQQENARADLYLRLLKNPSVESSPAAVLARPAPLPADKTYYWSLRLKKPVELKNSIGQVIAEDYALDKC